MFEGHLPRGKVGEIDILDVPFLCPFDAHPLETVPGEQRADCPECGVAFSAEYLGTLLAPLMDTLWPQ